MTTKINVTELRKICAKTENVNSYNDVFISEHLNDDEKIICLTAYCSTLTIDNITTMRRKIIEYVKSVNEYIDVDFATGDEHLFITISISHKYL